MIMSSKVLFIIGGIGTISTMLWGVDPMTDFIAELVKALLQ